MRRVHILGNLALSESGYTSGGLLADSVVDGRVTSGTQSPYAGATTWRWDYGLSRWIWANGALPVYDIARAIDIVKLEGV